MSQPDHFSRISASVSCSRKWSILPWRRFKNGQIEQVEDFSDGHLLSLEAQSKTVGDFPSAAHIISCTEISELSFAREKPPWAPLKEFNIPCLAMAWSILAKKLFEMSSSLDKVSASIGLSAFANKISDNRAYSLARVINIKVIQII